MKWTPLIAAPAAIVVIAPASANVYMSEQQAMQAIFPGASFSPGGRAGVFRASSGGIVVIDRVLGKHEYIKYAVGITAAGTVKRIEILEYNESYGYEVREASWRSQFVGKSASSPLQLNVDIKNISGATLSAKHITDGVRRLVGQFQSLKGQ
ncbi:MULTISPECIES: FMN-binding protein [unclassified Bradyrhizobium]|uniref:FMN-binding protein n=1 Tax=unclassified Bradyrhizobium TaxID=2631580 RepID=UPI0024792C53|nr:MULTISPECIES: FMN-binding protein [unclassified Bradyrhizobium]WGR71974.1 FMN-binding protein [Bradyrhizobium sp. ISRA426]WGR76808.1 FMN-binding protein [Bradyrhizobium sp. ISRA430]WGR87213.1 FMN-binding protein [Bradyrhizobium sp. ISRA432]